MFVSSPIEAPPMVEHGLAINPLKNLLVAGAGQLFTEEIGMWKMKKMNNVIMWIYVLLKIAFLLMGLKNIGPIS